MNIRASNLLLNALAQRGCREIVLCAGARNAPLVEVLSRQNFFKITTHFDERGASFFGLARVRQTKSPVAVITTSGTAVAECLPAVIEAYYQEQSLIVVSADRPKGLRGTGAPQTIDQSLLLSSHCELALDIDAGEQVSLDNWNGRGPVHINVCFDEPLVDESDLNNESFDFSSGSFQRSIPPLSPSDREWLNQAFFSFKNPLFIVSGLESERERKAVESLFQDFEGAVYFERTSGVDFEQLNLPGQIKAGEHSLGHYLEHSSCDGIIRIGSIPTAKIWRQIDQRGINSLSFSELPFAGAKTGTLVLARIDHIAAEIKSHMKTYKFDTNCIEFDGKVQGRLQGLYQEFKKSEVSFLRSLALQVSGDQAIYLGNSLPIRNWDLVSQDIPSPPVLANRGVNGIDGQLASGIAFAQTADCRVVVGDLTFMYDMNSLSLLHSIEKPIQIIVVNNKGGQIFSRLFDSQLYRNVHNYNFEKIAEQFSMEYLKIENSDYSLPLPSRHQLVELCPEAKESNDFWTNYLGEFND